MFRWKKKVKIPTLDGSSSDIPGKPSSSQASSAATDSQPKVANGKGSFLGSAKGFRGSNPSLAKFSIKRGGKQNETSSHIDQSDGLDYSKTPSRPVVNGNNELYNVRNKNPSNGCAGSVSSDSTSVKKRQAPAPPPRVTSLPRGNSLDSDILPLSPTTTASNDYRWSLRSGASSGSSLSRRSFPLSLPNSNYLTEEIDHSSAFSAPLPSKFSEGELSLQHVNTESERNICVTDHDYPEQNGAFSGSGSEKGNTRKEDNSSLTSESVSEASIETGNKSPVAPPRSRNIRKKSLCSTSSNSSSLSERDFKLLKPGPFNKNPKVDETGEGKENSSQTESDHGYGTFTVQEKQEYLALHGTLERVKNGETMVTNSNNNQHNNMRNHVSSENKQDNHEQFAIMTELKQSQKPEHLIQHENGKSTNDRTDRRMTDAGTSGLASRKHAHSRRNSRSSDTSVRKTLDFSEGDDNVKTTPTGYDSHFRDNSKNHITEESSMYNSATSVSDPLDTSGNYYSGGLSFAVFDGKPKKGEHQSDMNMLNHLSRFKQEDLNDDWLDKPVRHWMENDVIGWCYGVGLQHLKDIFEDSGITGPKLLQVTKDDLVDLNLHDESSQQHFIEEVNNLKQNKVSKSLWTLKQSSVRRKHLEFSNLQIKSNLDHLTKESSEQQERIAASLKALRDERHETEQILLTSPIRSPVGQIWSPGEVIRSPGAPFMSRGLSSSVESICTLADESFTYRQRRSSTGTVTDLPATVGEDDFIRVPLMYWGTMEVLKWLSSVSLDRFLDNFKALKISGRQLAQIDLKLLDDLKITSVCDREEILSRLYDLQHQSDLSNPAVPESPAIKNIIKPPVPIKTPNLLSKKRMSPRSSVKVTPAKSPGYKPKDNNTIQVWNDLNCPGNLVGTFLKVNESTTVHEAIEMLLGPSRKTHEADLYYIVESLQHKHTEVRELEKNECPLMIQREWPSTSAGKLELRNRNGHVIAITCKLNGVRSKTKQFRISYDFTSSDVLQNALHKFHINHVDPSRFCLLEIDKERKENHILLNSEFLRSCRSDSFFLCERSNVPLSLDLSVIQPNSESGRRQPSIDSQHSHSSKHSSESESHRTIHFDKLETLEAEMASIEASFFANGSNSSLHNSRQVAPKKQPLPSSQYYTSNVRNDDDNLELNSSEDSLLREIELLKESIRDRDTTIAAVSQENKRLQERSKQVVHLKERLSQVEEAFMLSEEQWQRRLQSEQSTNPATVSMTHSACQTCSEADEVRGQIEWIDSQIQLNELKVTNIQNVLDQKPPAPDPDELLHQQVAAQSVVEMLQREKSNLTSQLASLNEESAAKDEHTDVRQSSLPQLNVFEFLSENKSTCIVCVELELSEDGPNFMVVQDSQHHLVVKHVLPGCSLNKNDRIIEINGQQVLHLSESEFRRVLNEAQQPIRSVVLREKSNDKSSKSVDVDDYEIMKEDLEVTVMELESANQENADLAEELEICKKEILSKDEEQKKLQEDNATLEKQLNESRITVKELQSVIEQTKQHNNNVMITPRKPPRDDLEKRRLKEEINKLKAELSKSETNVSKSQATLLAKEALVSRLERQIKEAAVKIDHKSEDNISETEICYEDLDDSKPLWENLQGCSKGMILQALRDTISENSQRKVFLDQLLSLVIDRSPDLLEYVEENMEMPPDVSLKPEKFC